jgi:hypothetical protein
MERGITAALDPAAWSVLCAIYHHLPNVKPGKGRLESLSGRSKATVQSNRKFLRAVGLIDYEDNVGGRANTTKYTVADIRRNEVAIEILARLKGVNEHPLSNNKGGNGKLLCCTEKGSMVDQKGSTISHKGVNPKSEKGSMVDPEVRNVSSQDKCATEERAVDSHEDEPKGLFGETRNRPPSKEGASLKAGFTQFTDRWLSDKRSILKTYKFTPRDGADLAEVWNAVGEDLSVALAVIDQYFLDHSPYFQGHQASKLRRQLDTFVERALNAKNGAPLNDHANGSGRQRPRAPQRIAENLEIV